MVIKDEDDRLPQPQTLPGLNKCQHLELKLPHDATFGPIETVLNGHYGWKFEDHGFRQQIKFTSVSSGAAKVPNLTAPVNGSPLHLTLVSLHKACRFTGTVQIKVIAKTQQYGFFTQNTPFLMVFPRLGVLLGTRHYWLPAAAILLFCLGLQIFFANNEIPDMEVPGIENEDFDRAFRFIVTGQYLALHYTGSDFEIRSDYHARGALFYLSNDEKSIIHERTYIADLIDHPDYEGDVFHIRKGLQYLAQNGKWADSIQDALKVQIDPEGDYGDAGRPTPPSIPHPIIDVDNPISADGIDLYQPDKWFTLYHINGDSLWIGDAREFELGLSFGTNPFSDGMIFQLSKPEGKTRIRSYDGKYLAAMIEPSLAMHLDEGCRDHTKDSQCPKCKAWYTLGFSLEPQECLQLVPKGLPSMFVLYDGLYYYKVSERIVRVEDIDDASVFQFVA